MNRRSFVISAVSALGMSTAAHGQIPGFIHPLASTSSSASTDDLAFLPGLLREKTVIGLGEATHGSHELFSTKARLVEFLLRSGLIGTVAFELGFADAFTLDRYVTHRSDADPDQLLRDIRTFSISVVEVADLVRQMRAFNASRPASSMARIVGYDVQTPGREAALVLDWLHRTGLGDAFALGENLTALAGQKNTPIQALSPALASPVKVELEQLRASLAENRAALTAASDPAEFDAMLQALTVIGQAFDLFSAPSLAAAYDQRDFSGALNIAAWQAVDPRPIAVWAHNGHVNKGSFEFEGARLLGGHLSDRLGERYYAIATAFFEGEVRARHADDGVVINALPPAREGSIDDFLSRVDHNAYFVDLSAAKLDATWENIIDNQGVMRGVGAAYEPEIEARTYRPTLLAQQFDALVFIRHVTASEPI